MIGDDEYHLFASSEERSILHPFLLPTLKFGDNSEERMTIKILGDLFESLAGAIYVDSSYDLKTVWTSIYGLMKDVIDDFSTIIPKNPVRVVHERFPNIKFSVARQEAGLTSMSVMVNGKEYTDLQRSKKECKTVLAKRILKEFPVVK